ncbi:hypothetical protein S83_041656, partial [Arachis hypogaea]
GKYCMVVVMTLVLEQQHYREGEKVVMGKEPVVELEYDKVVEKLVLVHMEKVMILVFLVDYWSIWRAAFLSALVGSEVAYSAAQATVTTLSEAYETTKNHRSFPRNTSLQDNGHNGGYLEMDGSIFIIIMLALFLMQKLFRENAGSHDLPLSVETLIALSKLTREGMKIKPPRYDKSAFNGRGDRADPSTWPEVEGPLTVVLFEGWMLGFKPLPTKVVKAVDLQGGKLTSESIKFFSPIVIWTKFNSSPENYEILYSAFKDYYKVWLELVSKSVKETDESQIFRNLEAQHRYLVWREEKDPGQSVLKKLIGETLAKDLLRGFLFNGVDVLGSKTFNDYFPHYCSNDGDLNNKGSIIGKSFENRPWDERGEFLESCYFCSIGIIGLETVNKNLEGYYDAWDKFIKSWIVIKIKDPSCVYQWRLQ